MTTQPKPFPARRMIDRAAAIALLLVALPVLAVPAQALEIHRVVSRGGIEAWLVQDSSVPVIALRAA
jgi:zinc protease